MDQPEDWDQSLQSNVEKIVRNMTQQKSNLAEIEEEVTREGARLIQANRKLYSLSEELKRELERRDMSSRECDEKVRKLEQQMKQLKGDIETRKNEISSLESDKNELKQRIAELEEQLDTKQKEFDDALRKQGLSKDDAVKAKQAEIDQLRAEKNRLEQQVEIFEQLKQEMENRVSQKESELTICRLKLEDELKAKETTNREKEELKKELENCKLMVERLKQELEKLAAQYGEIESEKKALENTIQQLKNKMKDQLEYIHNKKQELIDGPVAKLKQTSAKLKFFADEAASNAERAKPGSTSEEGFISVIQDLAEADDSDVGEREETDADAPELMSMISGEREETDADADAPELMISAEPEETTKRRARSIKPIGDVGNKSSDISPSELRSVTTRSGRKATQLKKFKGGSNGLPPILV
jgi:chromosome segregation ATPase